MVIKEYLESLKDGNKLKEYVLDYYINDYDSYSNEEAFLKGMEDLQRHGCVSGMIRSLIYYDDTNEFYDKYKEEINELLKNVKNATGLSIEELFGNNFDKDDPLILDCFNKNLLAWFGFEETAYNIYENIYKMLNDKQEEFIY